MVQHWTWFLPVRVLGVDFCTLGNEWESSIVWHLLMLQWSVTLRMVLLVSVTTVNQRLLPFWVPMGYVALRSVLGPTPGTVTLCLKGGSWSLLIIPPPALLKKIPRWWNPLLKFQSLATRWYNLLCLCCCYYDYHHYHRSCNWIIIISGSSISTRGVLGKQFN